MPTPLIVGNWKMHGSQAMVQSLLDSLKPLVDSVTEVDWVVCPPAAYMAQVQSLLQDTHIGWGGQNHADSLEGAYTGETSASMLKDLGASWTILGHSERRHGFSESNDLVAKKTQIALAQGLSPIFCVGETGAERDGDLTEQVLQQQLAPLFEALNIQELGKVTFAYEPVWAIGTGVTATPEQAGEVHDFLRNLLVKMDESLAEPVRILYGGSVKPDNAEVLFSVPSIDGFLVGGAALQAQSFFEIGVACNISC